MPRETRAHISTFYSAAWAVDVFHGSVVLLCKINMKRQQKLTFFIEKRTAVEPPENDEEGPEKDGERSEESSINITISQLHEPTASATTTTVHNPEHFKMTQFKMTCGTYDPH